MARLFVNRDLRVRAFCLAMSDEEKIGYLLLGGFGVSYSHHDFGENTWKGDKDYGVATIPRDSRLLQGSVAVPLDTLVARGIVPVPNYIKIDVDGLEYRVYRGLRWPPPSGGKVMLISDEYRHLQRKYHVSCSSYGTSGHKWADKVKRLAEQLSSYEVLDYGSGKQTLQKNLPFPITNYDPCTPGYDTPPEPHDLVICTDVLEHVEPACLDNVLADLVRLVKRQGFFTVATRPAVKFLPDGRNAHLIQEQADWWLPKFIERFTLQSFERLDGELVVLVTPKASPSPVAGSTEHAPANPGA